MKSWTVIPAMGVVAAAASVVVVREPRACAIIAAGLAGAALAGAVRALADPSRASLVAAVLAPLLVIASFAEHQLVHVTPLLSVAAIAWTIVELARTPGRASSPLVAMLPATIAAILDPAAVALVMFAGARVVTAPWQRPRWAIAIPIAGGLAVILAVIAGGAEGGAFATLGTRWFGPAHGVGAPALAQLVGDALGPLTAVAALAGLALLAKLRLAELAVCSCALGALLVDLRAGAVGGATFGIAGLCAALAIGRFASIIRMPSLQPLAGIPAAMMLLVPPAWTVVEHLR